MAGDCASPSERTRRPARRSHRPLAEGLERRELLASFVVTNTNPAGPGSLAQAITSSNVTVGPNLIAFNIPGPGVHTIRPLPTAPLPAITNSVVLDATTQPGYAGLPLIEINGSQAGSRQVNGLQVGVGNSVVRGLAINGFSGSGLVLNLDGAGGNRVEANFIGTDPTGTKPEGNRLFGVVEQTANGDIIGGTLPADRNVISANGLAGISIQNSLGVAVEGNLVGTDVSGLRPLGNGADGVLVFSRSTAIGGIAPGAANTIAFNVGSGVNISAGAVNNSVLSNSIFANGRSGIRLGTGANNDQPAPGLVSAVVDARGTTVTGRVTGPPLSGLALQFFANPVRDPTGFGQGQTLIGTAGVSTDASGNASFSLLLPVAVPAGQVVTATATDQAFDTSQFSADQIVTAARLSFTVINTNDAGPGSLRQAILNANLVPGVNTVDFKIPGTGPQVIRLLSPLPAVTDPTIIDGFTQPGAAPNTSATGDNARVLIQVDGSAAGAETSGLVISAGHSTVKGLAFEHFGGWGMILDGAGGDQVVGSRLGTDAAGAVALGNGEDGILILDTAGNTIGGASPAARNIISANNADGVQILGGGATNNLVQGNLIGTDAAGASALGNQFAGVFVNGAPGNTIGGAAAGAGNIISGNRLPGIEILGPSATGNLVQGNLIGTDVSGTRPLGNVSIGLLASNAPRNTIGGTAAGAGNIISGNVAAGTVAPGGLPAEATGGGGVVILGKRASGNLVEGNLIGTDRTGTIALGNAYDGVSISGAPRNTVGGTAAGARNVISGNGYVGVRIVGPDGVANVVQENLIGTDASGTRSVGNGFGGIFVNGAPANVVGGPLAGNVVSGNRGSGVQLFGSGAAGNAVLGNLIGSDVSGRLGLGNGGDGVFLNGAPGNRIGGTEPGEGNLIVRSTGSGIDLAGRGAAGNLVEGNVVGGIPGALSLGNAAYGILVQDAAGNTLGGSAAGAANLIADNAFGGLAILLNGTPVVSPATAGNLVQGNTLVGNGLGPFHQPGLQTRAIRKRNRLHSGREL